MSYETVPPRGNSGSPTGRPLSWVDSAAAAREAQLLLDDLFDPPPPMTAPSMPIPSLAPIESFVAGNQEVRKRSDAVPTGILQHRLEAAPTPTWGIADQEDQEEDQEWAEPPALPALDARFDDTELLLDLSDFNPFENEAPERDIEAFDVVPAADDAMRTAAQDVQRHPRWDSWISPEKRRALLNNLTGTLLATAAKRGFITLHELARAAAWLRYDESLLDELCARLEGERVCATEAVAHTSLRGANLEGISERFATLFTRRPDEGTILRRLGYDTTAHISAETRAFIVQAFTLHQLTRVEEEELVRIVIAARTGGGEAPEPASAAQARRAIFLDNLATVVRIARAYQGQGLPLDDLIQEGCLGLMKAIDRYELGKCNRFMQYGAWWVTQRITRGIADHGRVIRLPVHLHEQIRQMDGQEETLSMSLGRAPSDAELAHALGVEIDRLQELGKWSKHAVSLDRAWEHRPGVVDRYLVREYGPADDLSNHSLRQDLVRALHTITLRERKVLLLRFGFTDQGPMTLEEVGQAFNLTRERIRQIEKKALQRLLGHRALRLHSDVLSAVAGRTAKHNKAKTAADPAVQTRPRGRPKLARSASRAAQIPRETGMPAAPPVRAVSPESPAGEETGAPKLVAEVRPMAACQPELPIQAEEPRTAEPTHEMAGQRSFLSVRSHGLLPAASEMLGQMTSARADTGNAAPSIASPAPAETVSGATAPAPPVEPLLLCPELLPRRPGISLMDELLFVQGQLHRDNRTKCFVDALVAWSGLSLPKGASRAMLARNALDLYFALGLVERTRLDAFQILGASRWTLDITTLQRSCIDNLRLRLSGMSDTYAMLTRGDTLHPDELAQQLFHNLRPSEWHVADARRRLDLLAALGMVGPATSLRSILVS